MLERAFRGVFMGLIRLYFRQIALSGEARVPAKGPVLVVSNHPNGLLDSLVVQAALGRRVASLAKSTLFGNPFGRLAMRAFDAIPVYRRVDQQDTQQNRSTFERCAGLLASGGWLVIFPEGTSHSDPQLKPIKTGAARIALQAEADGGFGLGLRVLPLGLVYEQSDRFRSRVAAVAGAPIEVGAWAEAYEEDAAACARALTEAIGSALADVVLEAEDERIWRGLLAVAAWTSPEHLAQDMGHCEAKARELARAYRRLMQRDPAYAERVVEATRAFVQLLEALGVEDPLTLEARPGTRRRVAAALVPLLTLWPVAVAGAALGWAPYRLVRPLAKRLAGEHTDLVSTLKVLLGVALLAPTYIAEAAWVGRRRGALWGLGMLVGAPLSGLVALRYGELLGRRRAALRGWWLRARRARVSEAIAARRRELCEMIEAALAEEGGALVEAAAAPGGSGQVTARD